MKTTPRRFGIAALTILGIAAAQTFACGAAPPATHAAASTATTTSRPSWVVQADRIMGQQATDEGGGVWRYDLTRTDLYSNILGDQAYPSFVNDGYLALKQEAGCVLGVGELVTLERETIPVVNTLEGRGVNVTAEHNHLVLATPLTIYVHYDKTGSATEIATDTREAMAQTAMPRAPQGLDNETSTPLPVAQMAAIMREQNHVVGHVVEFTAERKESATDRGQPFPPGMGPESEVHFQQGTGGAQTAGEFAVTEYEQPRVMAYMRAHLINVTAVHNHWVQDYPRYFFIHTYSRGDALTQARLMRGALDLTNVK